jgi:thermitase
MRMAHALKIALLTALSALVMAVAAAPASALAPYDDDTVLVKYRPGVSALQRISLADRVGLGPQIGAISAIDTRVMRVSEDPAAVSARLERSPLVAYAEPNFKMSIAATPNDPLFDDLWGLHNTGQTGGTADADIDAPEGWGAAGLGTFPATGGAKVGIVDTGIQLNHPDLSGKVASADCGGRGFGGSIVTGKCNDGNGHGTHVSGTIAAKANNNQGVAGVSFNSPLAMCRALNRVGVGSTNTVANCIIWLHDRGAEVISMSLGGGDSSTLKAAVDYAWDGGSASGSVIVAAAGNNGNSTLSYPAAYGNVVSVAATDDEDKRASFSNANSDVEIAAPGVDILSTWKGSGYMTISGTSMATPHVAGVAALIRDRYPTSTASQIVSKLRAAVDDLGAAGRDNLYGFGRVNLYKAATG